MLTKDIVLPEGIENLPGYLLDLSIRLHIRAEDSNLQIQDRVQAYAMEMMAKDILNGLEVGCISYIDYVYAALANITIGCTTLYLRFLDLTQTLYVPEQYEEKLVMPHKDLVELTKFVIEQVEVMRLPTTLYIR